MAKFKNAGTWWHDRDIDLVDIEGTVYALNGWNGEKYLNCWVCTGEDLMDANEKEYGITPIYNNNEEDPETIGYEVI